MSCLLPGARYRLGYWFRSVPASGKIGYTHINIVSSIKPALPQQSN